ncbi:MAG: hypothetical protein QE271_12540 [Bacteriovoracaceae bacterium]|nr:hypothetical protein [Bacteriovoracaceae bacterium]
MAVIKNFFPFSSLASLLILTLTLSLAGLTSCSSKKKSSTVAPQYNPGNPNFNSNPVNINPNPTAWSNNGGGFMWNFEYYFYDSQNACSTGRHMAQGYNKREVRNAICQELQNAQINNNCAEQQRRQLFRQYCSCRRRCWNSNSYFSFGANVQVRRENMPGQDQGQQMPAHQNFAQESRGNSTRQW